MKTEDWPAWQESCRQLAVSNLRRGYTHAGVVLHSISETRLLHCDVPMAELSKRFVWDVATALKKTTPEYYTRVWRAQWEYWFAVWRDDDIVGERLHLADAVRMAEDRDLVAWIRRQIAGG